MHVLPDRTYTNHAGAMILERDKLQRIPPAFDLTINRKLEGDEATIVGSNNGDGKYRTLCVRHLILESFDG